LKKHLPWFKNGHDIAHLIPIAHSLYPYQNVADACLAHPMMNPGQQLAYMLALLTYLVEDARIAKQFCHELLALHHYERPLATPE
jgi:hypothetical protein